MPNQQRDSLRLADPQPARHLVDGYTALGLSQVLHHAGLQLRYCNRARRLEYATTSASPLDWAPLNDRDLAAIRDWAAQETCYKAPNGTHPDGTPKHTLKPWKPPWSEYQWALNALAHQHTCDGFQTWLNSLPEWDQQPRAETLIVDCLTVHEDDHTSALWAARHLLAGPIHLARHPGDGGMRTVPVLVGPQDAGKSQLAAELLPPATRDLWHGDDLRLDQSSKEIAEGLAGRVIVEISEMGGRSRADLERIKAFITRRNDGQHRSAYGRTAEAQPRRTILIATANDTGDGILPRDPSGQSRWAIIRTTGTTTTAATARTHIQTNRDQLWAEALHHYNTGHPDWANPRYPTTNRTNREQTARQHATTDEWLEDKLSTLDRDRAWRLADIITTLELPNDRGAQTRLRQTLKANGWTDTRQRDLNGNQYRAWKPAR